MDKLKMLYGNKIIKYSDRIGYLNKDNKAYLIMDNTIERLGDFTKIYEIKNNTVVCRIERPIGNELGAYKLVNIDSKNQVSAVSYNYDKKNGLWIIAGTTRVGIYNNRLEALSIIKGCYMSDAVITKGSLSGVAITAAVSSRKILTFNIWYSHKIYAGCFKAAETPGVIKFNYDIKERKLSIVK